MKKNRFLVLLTIICMVCVAALIFTSCKTDPTFDIKFVVDGKEYAKVTTSGNEKITMPTNPTKEGYRFDGWYVDDGEWQTQFKESSLSFSALTSNLTVYAKFVVNEQYNNLQGTEIETDAFVVDGDNLTATVANSVTTFSFVSAIKVANSATFIVTTDFTAINVVRTKTVQLEEGDNTYYILVENGDDMQLYTVMLRRRPLYTVTFATNGGTPCDSQQVEENDLATQPTTTKVGYTFVEWDYDFKQAITANTTIAASWTANKYTLTLDPNGGEVEKTEYTVTFDASYSFNAPTYTGHTFAGWYVGETKITNYNGQSVSNWKYDENKTATAKWTVNSYMITITKTIPAAGVAKGSGAKDYDSEVTLEANVNLGYEWLGWYNGNELISNELSYTFNMPATSLNITANYKVRNEMRGFTFESTPTDCNITSVRDDTITEITIPEYITHIAGGTFSGCSDLAIVYYAGDLAGWFNIDFAYKDANPLYLDANLYIDNEPVTELVIPDAVTAINNFAFNGSNITSVTIPNGVTKIGNYAFANCDNLSEVTIGSNVDAIGSHAFDSCSELTIVVIPDGVTAISDEAFSNCSGLKTVVIGCDVKTIGKSAFSDCTSLQAVYWNAAACTEAGTNQYPIFVGDTRLTTVVIGSNVTSMPYYAFSCCTSLTSVHYRGDIAGWCNINFASPYANPLTNAHNLYIADVPIIELVIPDAVTTIKNYTFDGCTSMTSVTIHDKVTSIGESAFSGCSGLTSVVIPDSVITIEYGAFSGCSGLTSVVIPDSVITIEYGAFYNCSKITSVVIPDSVTSIGTYAFCYCSELTSVTIGDSITTIGNGAFSNCGKLTNVVIPDSVKSLGDSAFSNCTRLTNVTIGNGVTTIGKAAFQTCSNLTSIVIGSSVTKIDDYAFYECFKLNKVYYKGSAGDWAEINIGFNFNNYLTKATRYYYSETEPTEDGNYWHYGDNDEIVVWTKE